MAPAISFRWYFSVYSTGRRTAPLAHSHTSVGTRPNPVINQSKLRFR
jgi:hypothetical protein